MKNNTITYLIIISSILLIFNQISIFGLESNLTGKSYSFKPSFNLKLSSNSELKGVDISSSTSTAQTVSLVFAEELSQIKTSQDAIDLIFPKGTPEYGNALGVSFDDPVNSIDKLAKNYRNIKSEVKKNNPEAWQRYLSLAASPKGISCEFCCGVGPQGVDKKGNLRCGCKHNIAMQSLALWLVSNTDLSDAEILKEAMKWKTLMFPRDMISLTTNLANGQVDTSNLPGMVGGC